MDGKSVPESAPRTCPVCGTPLVGPGFERRAFCSRRCREIDLMKWLNEEYRIREERSDGYDEGDIEDGEPNG